MASFRAHNITQLRWIWCSTCKKTSLIGQVNKILCTFRNVNCSTKTRLVQSYCTSFYGAETWDLSGKEAMCVLWFVSKRGAKCSLNNLRVDSASLAMEFINAIIGNSIPNCYNGKHWCKCKMVDIFHWSGNMPWRKDEFIIVQIGAASK